MENHDGILRSGKDLSQAEAPSATNVKTRQHENNASNDERLDGNSKVGTQKEVLNYVQQDKKPRRHKSAASQTHPLFITQQRKQEWNSSALMLNIPKQESDKLANVVPKLSVFPQDSTTLQNAVLNGCFTGIAYSGQYIYLAEEKNRCILRARYLTSKSKDAETSDDYDDLMLIAKLDGVPIGLCLVDDNTLVTVSDRKLVTLKVRDDEGVKKDSAELPDSKKVQDALIICVKPEDDVLVSLPPENKVLKFVQSVAANGTTAFCFKSSIKFDRGVRSLSYNASCNRFVVIFTDYSVKILDDKMNPIVPLIDGMSALNPMRFMMYPSSCFALDNCLFLVLYSNGTLSLYDQFGSDVASLNLSETWRPHFGNRTMQWCFAVRTSSNTPISLDRTSFTLFAVSGKSSLIKLTMY